MPISFVLHLPSIISKALSFCGFSHLAFLITSLNLFWASSSCNQEKLGSSPLQWFLTLSLLKSQACELQEQGRLLEIVDPSLGANYSKEEAQEMLNLALACTSPSPTLRPPMSAVVSMLEGRARVEVPSMELHTQQASEEFGIETSEKLFSDSQTRSISTGGSWVGSSLSMPSSKGGVTFYSSTSRPHSGYTE